jgi:O-antigen ligase
VWGAYEAAHSAPLRALGESGILGLAAYVWMVIRFARDDLETFLADARHRRREAALSAGFAASLAAAVVASSFENFLEAYHVGMLFFIVRGLAHGRTAALRRTSG